MGSLTTYRRFACGCRGGQLIQRYHRSSRVHIGTLNIGHRQTDGYVRFRHRLRMLRSKLS